VRDKKGAQSISQSMQLMAGRTAQQYNVRKKRVGAFWEDRYHATAVQRGEHLRRCIAYIDLNMVRAGVVREPHQWKWCGYADIMNTRTRNRVIDYKELMRLLDVSSMDALQTTLQTQVSDSLHEGSPTLKRQPQWTEAVAVGTSTFVEDIKDALGDRAGKRKTHEACEGGQSRDYILKESEPSYEPDFKPKIAPIWAKNADF
jgi:putative transposase